MRRYVPISLAITTVLITCSVAVYIPGGSTIGGIGGSNTFSRHLSLIDEDQELPPLFPFEAKDYLGFSVAVLGLLLAAGGGIGGGGILVPTYILLLDFPVKHAIPLASATVLGGAVANNILNARKYHPDHPGRPVIDWDLILQLEPMTILGALVGAILNDFLPEILLVVLMVLLLAVTAQNTLSKAHEMYQKESEELRFQRVGEGMPLLSKDTQDANTEDISKSGEEGANYMHQAFLDVIKLSALFIVVTVLNLVKGRPSEAGGGPLGLNSCGDGCFWVTQIGICVVILVFVVYARSNLLSRKRSGGLVLSEIEWSEENTITYPIFAIVAGLVAGLFGVGGGIIKGPLMLALGMYRTTQMPVVEGDFVLDIHLFPLQILLCYRCPPRCSFSYFC
jgi:uncharacterized membrane protein YfcA